MSPNFTKITRRFPIIEFIGEENNKTEKLFHIKLSHFHNSSLSLTVIQGNLFFNLIYKQLVIMPYI